MVDALCGFPKILRFGGGYVDKGLWVAIYQWEPGTLYLDHNAMTAAESVQHVGHRELNFCYFAWIKWFRFLEAVAKSTSENISADELLVSPHADVSGVWVWVVVIACVNIYDLNYPIGVGAAGRDVEGCLDRPSDR